MKSLLACAAFATLGLFAATADANPYHRQGVRHPGYYPGWQPYSACRTPAYYPPVRKKVVVYPRYPAPRPVYKPYGYDPYRYHHLNRGSHLGFQGRNFSFHFGY